MKNTSPTSKVIAALSRRGFLSVTGAVGLRSNPSPEIEHGSTEAEYPLQRPRSAGGFAYSH